MIAMVAITATGCSTNTAGSSNMPTETKNSTANASRSGMASSAARWLRSLSPEHHSGEEGRECEGDAEQMAAP